MSGEETGQAAGAEDGGRFRRLIDLSRRDERTVVGWLEDDVHHFGLTLIHDGDHVTEVAMSAIRYPYTSCCAADVPLRALEGAALSPRASDIGRLINMRLQCTHLFDLAGLALAHAASGRAHRRYEATVEDRKFVELNEKGRRVMGPGRAQLWMDGVPALGWHIERQMVTAPDEWAGWPLMDGFRERSEALDVDLAEQALVLRRAIMVSAGRTAMRYPLPRDRGWPGVCHTFQPGQKEKAERFGIRRNYERSSEGMLSLVDQIPGQHLPVD